MKFGRPVLEKAAPEPELPPVKWAKVIARLSGGWEWSWPFEGEEYWAEAQALYAKLTGPPDEQGWIRNVGDSWAYRPEEIRGVRVEWGNRPAKAESEAAA